jgi:hypothetical protein
MLPHYSPSQLIPPPLKAVHLQFFCWLHELVRKYLFFSFPKVETQGLSYSQSLLWYHIHVLKTFTFVIISTFWPWLHYTLWLKMKLVIVGVPLRCPPSVIWWLVKKTSHSLSQPLPWACDQGKGLQRCGPRVNSGVSFHAPGSAREYEGMDPHTPKWAPTLEVEVPMNFQISRRQLQGSNFIRLRSSLYHWKFLGT